MQQKVVAGHRVVVVPDVICGVGILLENLLSTTITTIAGFVVVRISSTHMLKHQQQVLQVEYIRLHSATS